MAIEWEMALWKPFYNTLSEEEKTAFDALMDDCRNASHDSKQRLQTNTLRTHGNLYVTPSTEKTNES